MAHSVLTHEAIIDAAWETDLRPLLLKRLPAASAEDLRMAHACAYGGAIIHDMEYYPFGSRRFTDLTHYVRSGSGANSLTTMWTGSRVSATSLIGRLQERYGIAREEAQTRADEWAKVAGAGLRQPQHTEGR